MNVAASMLDALDNQLIGSRPSRLSPANYGDIKSYRQDLRTRNGDYASAKDALSRAYRALAVDVLKEEDLKNACNDVWSGRLSCSLSFHDGTPRSTPIWEYTAGQYYPLEVFAAIAAVLDRAILRASERAAGVKN